MSLFEFSLSPNFVMHLASQGVKKNSYEDLPRVPEGFIFWSCVESTYLV